MRVVIVYSNNLKSEAQSLKDDINIKILTGTISFIKATKRFDKLDAFNET